MVRRGLGWFCAVVVLEAGLVLSGRVGVGGAVLVLVGIEVLLGLTGLVLVVRRYRGDRRRGVDVWRALEGGLETVLPRPVARLVASEPRLFLSLARWGLGGGRRTGEAEFRYGKGSPLGTLVLMVLLTAPVEVAFWEIVVPWGWLRWALLALSVYSVLWLLGLYASRITHPHRLEEEGLRLRQGIFAEAFVPYSGLRSVDKKRRPSPKSGDGLQSAPEGCAAYLAIGGRVDLTLTLERPLLVRGFLRDVGPVRTVHVAADDSGRMVRELRRRLEEVPAPVSSF